VCVLLSPHTYHLFIDSLCMCVLLCHKASSEMHKLRNDKEERGSKGELCCVVA